MGFRSKARTREFVCQWEQLAPDEGKEPFKATIRTNLTFAELDALPESSFDLLFSDAQAAIAPYVVAWNLEGVDAATGEETVLPPPAEAGPEIFEAINSEEDMQLITTWIFATIKNIHRGGPERKKELRRSSATPATKNGSASISPMRTTAKARRQSQPITT